MYERCELCSYAREYPKHRLLVPSLIDLTNREPQRSIGSIEIDATLYIQLQGQANSGKGV
jgi:hypothetical protein